MNAEDIKWLHLESSTYCNAWCPKCDRNNNGYGLSDQFVKQDINLTTLENLLDQLPNLIGVQLCGKFGDPIAGNNVLEVIQLAKRYTNKIQIHTNGSLRNTEWWQNLAHLLSDVEHSVWFGIDGLRGIHEIHRQGTDFNKVIDNATSFINNGGTAIWQFIPFEHNEHQIKDCLKLSQQLKFKSFKLVKSQNRRPAPSKHYVTQEEFYLNPPKTITSVIQMPKSKDSVQEVALDQCMHLSMPSVYMAANGKLSWCCYFPTIKEFNTLDQLLNAILDLKDRHCIHSCADY